MRKPIRLSIAVALLCGILLSVAEAQPARRLGGRLRGAPGNAPGAGAAPREGQLRERMQNLGGKLQGAIDSGALDTLTGKAGANLPGSLPATAPNNLSAGSQLKANWQSGNQPFTPAWYADHPQAWQYTHPHADAWAVATIGTAAAWLGIATLPPASATSGENVYTSESVAPPAETPAVGDYLPLGVFALGPAGAQEASALLQLAVSKEGELRGNYYDVVTGQEQPLKGQLNKETQLATFKLEAAGSAEFEISLVSLTRPEGSARLRFDNGQTRDWSLARFEPPTASK